jgi:hypothetical protein
MQVYRFNPVNLDPKTQKFYQEVLRILSDAKVPFLIGGSYCLEAYTGNGRHTKDLDIFVYPADAARTLQTLADAGYVTQMVFRHWLGKVFCEEDFIDVIFSSGNGLCKVDEEWFAHAVEGEVLQRPVKLCPVEEIIWQKSFIMERERFDGADLTHLLRAHGKDLDWTRLLRRFGPHWRAAGPPDPLRLHLPRTPSCSSRGGDARASGPFADGEERFRPERSALSGHPPFPSAIPRRYRTLGL